MTQLSIVVPVYNVEQYLEQALDSLVRQDTCDMEVLIVDDGSSDSSLSIARKFEEADSRFRVIQLEWNLGYGKACNVGMLHARGEYLAILEPDDYVEFNGYHHLLSCAVKNNLDLIRFGFRLVVDGKAQASSYQRHFSEMGVPMDCVIRPSDYPLIFLYQPTVWGFLYRRDMLVRKRIQFNETPGASYQDTSFYFKVLAIAETLSVSEREIYYYRQHPEQSVKSTNKVDAPVYELQTIRRFLTDSLPVIGVDRYLVLREAFVIKALDYYVLHLNRLDETLKESFYMLFRAFVKNGLCVDRPELFEVMSGLSDRHRKLLTSIQHSPGLADFKSRIDRSVPNSIPPILFPRVEVRRISPAGVHAFYGYYDSLARNRDGKHLYVTVSTIDRLPSESDRAEIWISDGLENWLLSSTDTWCFQQGCMLQFRPGHEYEIVYNRFEPRDCKYVAVIHNLKDGSERLLPLPITAVSSCGNVALSINFSRLYDYRPGYGYCNVKDAFASDLHPANDGLYIVDMDDGEFTLVLSYERIWLTLLKSSDCSNRKLVLNHVAFSPDGSRILILLRVFNEDPPWPTFTLLYDLKTDHISKIFGFGSHYNWRDSQVLAVTGCDVMKREHVHEITLHEIDTYSGLRREVDPDFFVGDGHCSYSPDRRFMLYDSYSKKSFPYQRLLVYDLLEKRGICLGYFHANEDLYSNNVDCRCDLHPRWSSDGKWITFDSIHEGFRGVYEVSFEDVVSEFKRRLPATDDEHVQNMISGYLRQGGAVGTGVRNAVPVARWGFLKRLRYYISNEMDIQISNLKGRS